MAEASAASKIATGIATNVLGAEALDLTEPLFSALGIPQGIDKSAEYFEAIMSNLQKIEGSLQKVTQKLNIISGGIVQIENALTAISSQIQDVELQSQLSQYSNSVSVIKTNFQAFSLAITAMGDESTFQAGCLQLFELFSITNADAVAVSMLNIRNALVGQGEMKGIISFQGQEFNNTYSQVVSNLPTTTVSNGDSVSDEGYVYWNLPFIDGSNICNALVPALQETFDNSIIPTLKAALAVQCKGLIFLTAAWTGTINESSLTNVISQIQDVATACKGVFGLIDFDTELSLLLKSKGQRLTNDQQNYIWPIDAEPPSTITFDDSYIFWTTNSGMVTKILPNGQWAPIYKGPWVILIHAPWDYGTRIGYHIGNIYGYHCIKCDDTLVSRPSTFVQMPDNFKSFIDSIAKSV